MKEATWLTASPKYPAPPLGNWTIARFGGSQKKRGSAAKANPLSSVLVGGGDNANRHVYILGRVRPQCILQIGNF
jgi:hypothetical protein